MGGRPHAGAQAGERKLVTILFADLSGYTALSERLDPEEVYSFLRPGMLELEAIVRSFGGSVPQIQGDGFMAVFGVPRAHEDDAERAVRAALACRDHVRTLNVDRVGLAFPEVHAGVNSGEVMVGPSDEASGFTVVGDTVNTASRLADLARAGQIVVDEKTKVRTATAIRYGDRQLRRAKGKAEPIATYQALGIAPTMAAAAPTGTFVDREEFLALLGRELELTEQEGRGRVVVVAGEPGIGKSRLAQELGHSLPAERFFVGRCAPFGDRGRLSALAQIVGGAIGAGGSREAARTAIDRTSRRIGRTSGVSVATELRILLGADEPASQTRSDRDVVHAARLVMEDATRAGPIAAVLDDLQWADRSIHELLADAHRSPWEAPVLLLGLSREPLDALPATALARARVARDAHPRRAPVGGTGVGGNGSRAVGARQRQRAVPRRDGRDARRARRGASWRRRVAPGGRRVDRRGARDDPARDRRAARRAAARREAAARRRIGVRVLHVARRARRDERRRPARRGAPRSGRAWAAPQAAAQLGGRHHRVRLEARVDPRRGLRDVAPRDPGRAAPPGRRLAPRDGATGPRAGRGDRVPVRTRVGAQPPTHRPGAERRRRCAGRRIPHASR